MGLLYATEAWVLSIMGWVWLTTQELWGFSLLSAVVFYGLLLLSTVNLILVACYRTSLAPKSGYFCAVLVFALSTASIIFDTLPGPSLGSNVFQPPGNSTAGCGLSKMNQIYYFSNATLYLLQAGVILGYLLIQLLVAAAQMSSVQLEATNSLWPGPAWGTALAALISFRFFVVFSGGSRAVSPASSKDFFYVQLFSEPLWDLGSVFLFFFECALVLTALEGFPLGSLPQRKFLRFFVIGFTLIFVVTASSILSMRGMLTVPTLLSLLLVIPPAVVGTVEAAMAKPAPHDSASSSVDPSAPPEHLLARSVYNRGAGRLSKNYIPVPVEMLVEKSKAV